MPRRWSSLDMLRGLALWLMIAHHFASWTGGRVGERFVGFDGLVVTDLAAPIFAVGLGASAALVGTAVRTDDGIALGRLGRALLRWGQVLALGLAIDVAVGGGIDGGGVLPTLAVCGLIITLLAVAGVRSGRAWVAFALVAATLVVPLTATDPSGFGEELIGGPFAVPVYLVFAAVGAALVAATPAGERGLPLLRAAALVVGLGVTVALLDPAGFAPHGLWPPSRYPGDLAFTVWGLVAALTLWAALRRWCPADGRLGGALATAGRRTLLVFGLHYLLKLGLQHTGTLGTLDTQAWGWAAWAGVVAACAASAWPWRRPAAAAPAPATTEPVNAGTRTPR